MHSAAQNGLFAAGSLHSAETLLLLWVLFTVAFSILPLKPFLSMSFLTKPSPLNVNFRSDFLEQGNYKHQLGWSLVPFGDTNSHNHRGCTRRNGNFICLFVCLNLFFLIPASPAQTRIVNATLMMHQLVRCPFRSVGGRSRSITREWPEQRKAKGYC